MEQETTLEKMMKQSKTISSTTALYWKLRCQYLEKTLDQTYTVVERNNCRIMYENLRRREQ